MAVVLLVGVGGPERGALITALEQSGHTVVEAADSAAAAALAPATPPDLVVTPPVGLTAEALVRLADAIPDRAQALRDHEDDVDFAMSVARVGVSYRTLDSPKIAVSRSLASLMGLPPGTLEIERDDLLRHVHPEDVDRVRAAVLEAIQGGSEFQTEYRWKSPSGDWRWFRSNGRVSTSRPGQPARLFTSIADVTDRRALESQLQQVQKMEAIGQLAGGVAHDFNNLLTAIGGYASLLLDRAQDAEQREDIDEILKATKRAAGLTRQLLAFSRKQFVEPATVDLNGLVADMTSMLRRIIGENVELTTKLLDEGAWVRADRNQLEQVVLNLVVNARDAAAGRGRIGVATRVVTLGKEAGGFRLPGSPGTYVTFSVTDNGCGMSEETKQRLFEPFFTTKPRGQGTGLGLATVYGIVAQSGGLMDLVSEPGRGTTLTVYLPRHDALAGGEVLQEPPPPAGGSETILLAEDETPLRSLVRVVLERAGYKVVDAATPAEARARAESMPSIDMLLTDVVMPGGTGPELYRWLAAGHPSMRVLFMSGYAEQDLFDREGVSAAGAFLAKPFTTRDLIGRVRETLDGRYVQVGRRE
jgi:signal transduction histidine kinase/ActR/RegA family two-component response regulator